MTCFKIGIHGLPRSGTSWVGEIFNSCPSVAYRYQPLFSYAFKDYLATDCSAKNLDSFFKEILETQDPFVLCSDERKKGLLPRFEKTKINTIVYKEVRYHQILPKLLSLNTGLKLVLVLRNPMAVVSSWLLAPREFRKDLGWVEMEEWRYAPKKNLNKPEEFNGYEKWKEASSMFLDMKEQYPEDVYLLHYGTLVSQKQAVVNEMFQFVGLPMSEQTMSFLMNGYRSPDANPYSVNRWVNVDAKWEKELSLEIQEIIRDDLSGTDLEYLLDG